MSELGAGHDSGTTQTGMQAPKPEWKVTDAGSYKIQAETTSYIEFRLSKPSGMHKECYCNDCNLRFYVPPFGYSGECPRCNSTSVGWTEEIGNEQ